MSVVKNLPANAGDMGLISGLGRSSGEGNGNPLQYSFLGNPMNRGAWQVTIQEVTESDMPFWLNNNNDLKSSFWWGCAPLKAVGVNVSLFLPVSGWLKDSQEKFLYS